MLPSPIIATTPAHLHPLSCQSQTPTRTSSGPAEARLPVPGAEQGASDPHHRPSLGDSAPCNSSADNVSSLSVAPEMDSVSDAVTGGHVSDDEGPCQLPLPPVEQVVARVAELLHLQHGRNASVPDGALGGGSASVPLSWADPNLDVLVLHVKANDLFRHDQPGECHGLLYKQLMISYASCSKVWVQHHVLWWCESCRSSSAGWFPESLPLHRLLGWHSQYLPLVLHRLCTMGGIFACCRPTRPKAAVAHHAATGRLAYGLGPECRITSSLQG